MGVDVLDPWPKHWDEWMVQQGELVVSGSWLSAWSDSQVCSLISRELKNGEISSQKSSFYPMFYYKYLIFNENISQLNQIHQTVLTLCEFNILNAFVLPYPERW